MAKAIRLVEKKNPNNYREFNSQLSLAKYLGVDESCVRRGGPKILKETHYITYTSDEANEKYAKDILDKASELLKNSIKPIEEKKLIPYIQKESINGNVLVIPDLHAPFIKKGALEHCKMLRDKFECGDVVILGDMIDNHAMSNFDHDPDGQSPSDEFKRALEILQEWKEEFPIAVITVGSHDMRPYRKAFKAGLPSSWMKSLNDVIKAPTGWDFTERLDLDDITYEHGFGGSGDTYIMNRVKENMGSTVSGHFHTVCSIKYLQSKKQLLFGMNAGCLIDETQYAFAYGKYDARRPICSAGVVLNYGKLPMIFPM